MVPTRRIERRSLALQASAITRLARSAWDGAGDGDRTRYLSLTGRARHLQRITSMVREGKIKDDVVKTLTGEFGWNANPNGLAMRSVDALIAELKR